MCSEIEAAREIFIGQSANSRRKRQGSRRGAGTRELEKSCDAGRRMVDKGNKALQLKLAKWRTEIPPAVVDPRGKTEEAEERLVGCFYGGRRRRDLAPEVVAGRLE